MYTVFSKPACPYCDAAKQLLTTKGLDFEVINLDVGQPKLEGEQYISRDDLLAKIPSARTMPQIMGPDAELIGGYTELRAKLSCARRL